MLTTLRDFYFQLILHKPRILFLILVALAFLFAWHSTGFRLDASSDSLLLENDQALKFYRAIEARYGSDDFLMITYTPDRDLFSEPVKNDLARLRNSLKTIQRVKSVLTMLDVPLINSPQQSLSDIQKKVLTLESPETDQQLARQELLTSPLYKNLLLGSDGKTTAIQVNFKRDQKYYKLLEQRNGLREKALETELTAEEKRQLKTVSAQFDQHSISLQHQESEDIARVRQIMDQHRSQAHLFLGGIPMITSDSIDYIHHDLMTFGLGVLAFLVILLAVFFHQPRWILLPMLTCGMAGLFMVGFLGWVDWPVTVVSSNFISLMLIITLSLIVHLIVRYREIHAQNPALKQQELVRETVISKVQPCFFTAATTIVAFTSLIISGIRPVIDFGWMMTIGISMSFVVAFSLFPSILALFPVRQSVVKHDYTAAITGFFARLIQHYGKSTLLLFLLLAILSIAGMSRLSVENRFIDYYKENTEIYQGMSLIDNRLGGTTPLDVIIDAPAEFFTPQESSDYNNDPLFEELALELEEDEETGITGSSYWFNNGMLPAINRIHNFLDDLPESGKVLSISSSLEVFRRLDESMVMDDFFLSVLYKRLPEDIKQSLFYPYMSKDGNQLRFSIRVYESDPTLKREELLNKIHHYLTDELGLADDQVHLTGMLVLYNNLLQSLFKSQILTIGVVFIAILLMFAVSFRNIKMAALAVLPNIVAAITVLGLMGWLNIPLDIMTITIAAICIGIAVDDTIHYVHRFTEEFSKDGDYWASIKRSHNSIGRAMYYTTITITLGFSILALSNFIPSIYFGLLTGFSMLIALLADLTLLPLLIVLFKPLKKTGAYQVKLST
jgi:predicted RND superfamily exporter protein